jgi:cytochrome c oxidase subunit III
MTASPWQTQFGTKRRQYEAARLAMWLFLVTEVLLFGGLFVAYAYYRVAFSDVFREEISKENVWLGTSMSLVLLTASVLVSQAISAIRRGKQRTTSLLLYAAVVCAVGFLFMHGFEYASHAKQHKLPGMWYSAPTKSIADSLFYALFFIMTGLHMLHVTVGACVLAAIGYRAGMGKYTEDWHIPVEVGGLYWHLVDTIWMFLFPLFYLAR